MGIDVVILARFLLTGIAVLLVFLASITWSRRREAPEAGVFALLVGAMAIYAFGYAGEIAQTTVAGAQRWLNVEYLALPWVPALWLLAACRHNGLKIPSPLLFVIPVITFAGHYTNYHNLFYTAPAQIIHEGPFWILSVQRGPLSILDNSYLLLTYLAGSWLYISRLRHSSSLFRRQAIIMVVGTFLPGVGYFVYLGGLSPWNLDLTPVTLGITCILFFYGLFRFGIFDLAPLGRTLIFNSIRDAVVIVDTRNRILDINPAAYELLPALHQRSIGSELTAVLAATPTLASALCAGEEHAEFTLGEGAAAQSLEIRPWPLMSGKRQMGRAIIIADITAQVHLHEELRRRAETDPLTGVANRRRFHQALEMECLRFSRGQAPLSVLMIDLDYFKDINDRYGHPAGDEVLKTVAQILLVSLRKTDLLARYGGEEFSVLLPETRTDGARIIAERMRQAVCQDPIEIEGARISISVSLGVASHATDQEVQPEILLKKADLALYRAKATGRNRVEVI
jgi:diguanylate cyclase (GGDEF)-like protein